MKILYIVIMLFINTACIVDPIVKKVDHEKHQKQNIVFEHMIDSLARNGYWLVTRGYKATDNIVSNATGLPISHVAVLDKANRRVIEADASGVHFTSLKKFINMSHRIIIMKPRWYDDKSGDLAVDKAIEIVGGGYDFLGLIGVNVPSRYYCSELAIFVYKDVIPKSTKFPDVLKPGEMYLYGSITYDSLPRDEIE